MIKKIKGVITACITPFDENHQIDIMEFCKFIQWQVTQKIDALLICGSTGEGSSLKFEERETLIRHARSTIQGQAPLMVGITSNYTKNASMLAAQAQSCGADALLISNPSYIKPTKEGLCMHYKEICNSCDLPIYLYNVPSRTGYNMDADLISQILHTAGDQIVGIKDASGDLSNPLLLDLKCGNNFSMLSGDDMTWLGFMSHGGSGVISVASNLFPKKIKSIHDAILSNNWSDALSIHKSMIEVYLAINQNNPIAIKYALHKIKGMGNHLRSPLYPINKFDLNLETKIQNIV